MSTPSQPNYSIHSIIAAYGIGLIPHGYYFVTMMANARGQASNLLYDPAASISLSKSVYLSLL